MRCGKATFKKNTEKSFNNKSAKALQIGLKTLTLWRIGTFEYLLVSHLPKK
jgi:hypothetical protein